VADVVLAAARRAAVGGVAALRDIQADRAVQEHVNSPSRVIDLMTQLADQGLVRMTCRHPECRWRVTEEEA
jgi:citrate lyase beta subunit